MITAREVTLLCKAGDLTSPNDCSQITDALLERSRALGTEKGGIEILLHRAVRAVHRSSRHLREAALSEAEQVDRLLRGVARNEQMPADDARPVLRARSLEYASRLMEAYANYQATLLCYETTAVDPT